MTRKRVDYYDNGTVWALFEEWFLVKGPIVVRFKPLAMCIPLGA